MAKIQEFFIEGSNQERSHVLLHITEPSTPEEEKKGYFFALCEINNGTVEHIEHLQKLIDDLESGYYETDDTEQKSAFEITLEYVNRRGHQILRDGNVLVHCLVGIFRDNKLALASHGRPLAELFYSRRGKVEIMDILGDDAEPSRQLFSAVVEGSAGDEDTIYLASPHVGDYVDNDWLLANLSSSDSINDAIQRRLKHANKDLSFGGIFIRNGAVAAKASPKEPDRLSRGQMETNYRARTAPQESFFSRTLITVGRALVAGLAGLYRILKRGAIITGKLLVGLFLLTTNKGGQRQIVLQSINRNWRRKKQFFADMPMVSKILLALAVLLALIFTASVGVFRLRAKQAAKLTSYRLEVAAVEDKRVAAEASMIYGDDAKALELLREAEALVKKLPTGTKDRAETARTLQASLDGGLLKLRKMKTVAPKLIADIASVDNSAKTTRIAQIDGKIIAFGADDAKMYTADAATGKIESRAQPSGFRAVMASTPKENDAVVILGDSNALSTYQKESGVVSAKTFAAAPTAKISAIFVYNQRLYSIDQSGNTILKHAPTQTGYDRGTSWLKSGESPDLKDGISLAIDGDLFILKATGEIIKLVSGRAASFAVTGLDPALDRPTVIWTYNEVNYLYILEPTNKRIVVLDKSGKLIQQYTASEWQNPTGMAVDEAHKVIYVLDGNKIYSFNF